MEQESIIVSLWTSSLKFLEKLSLFNFIRRFLLPKTKIPVILFVDGWILGHTLLSIVYLITANLTITPFWLKYALLIYGCLRMFEILIYQLNVILVHPYVNQNYALNSYRRMTIALLHNFVEIIFWFAGSYLVLQFVTTGNALSALYSSFIHMVSFSFAVDESNWSIITFAILMFQGIIGLFMTLLSLARFVSLFPQPTSNDPKEKEANEQRHNHLMGKLIELEEKHQELIRTNSELIEQNAQAIKHLAEQSNKVLALQNYKQ